MPIVFVPVEDKQKLRQHGNSQFWEGFMCGGAAMFVLGIVLLSMICAK